MSNVGLKKEKMTEVALRERRLDMIKEADKIGFIPPAASNLL